MNGRNVFDFVSNETLLMKNFLNIFLIFTLLYFSAADGTETIPRDSLTVAFLDSLPSIDGKPDDFLKFLPEYSFSEIYKTEEKLQPLDITYRLGYNSDFLYLYIEFPRKELTVRDRAYQNGDGFHMALVLPEAGNQPSNEFYVMGFSPDNSPRRKFIWYYNVDLAFQPLQKSHLAISSHGGKTGFELLLDWREVYPYHPWLQKAMGFNLCFVQAEGEQDKIYYFTEYDPKFQSEQSSRRYKLLKFQLPDHFSKISGFQVLQRNYIFRGDTIRIRAAITSGKDSTITLPVTLRSGEGERIAIRNISTPVRTGLNRILTPLEFENLPPGGYTVAFHGTIHETGLTILPPFDKDSFLKKLKASGNYLSRGSINSLQFKIEQADNELLQLKSYDTAGKIRIQIQEIKSLLAAAENGDDILARRRGIFRRAYRSDVDGTLQPYSIAVPEEYNPAKEYPLLVYLHGSGEDDRDQLQKIPDIEGMIRVAPSGRGTSNAYSTNHAQDDIRECIDDVVRNYSIDTSRIILSGFSMGGYGVYRSFYEYPNLFHALAVFSGHPNLANQYLGGNHPNFLEKEYTAPFRNIPIFIFHGMKDRNCPYELTEKTVELLKLAGADVIFISEPDKGHERPGERTMDRYRDWLKKISNH